MGGVPSMLSCGGIPEASFLDAVARVDLRIEALEEALSSYRPASAISRFNAGGKGEYELGPDAGKIVAVALELARATDGAFDVTVGGLVRLWKQAERDDHLPGPSEVREAFAESGAAKLALDSSHRLLTKSVAGLRVDLGGLAKGYMADEARRILVAAGCSRAIVELGGDVALAKHEDQRDFSIGVNDPRLAGHLFGVLRLRGGAVVTSGDYERFLTIKGQRYAHIIDPRTGRPVARELASVTVVSPDGMYADAWATAFFVLGWERSMEIIAARDELEAVLIHDDGRVHVSEGLRSRFKRR